MAEEVSQDIAEFYRRTNDHENRLVRIESREPFLEDILTKNTKAYEKLATTLQDIQTSMVTMTSKMDAQEQTVNSIREDLNKATQETHEEIAKANQRTTEEISKVNKKTREEIEKVNSRVDVIDEKGKFDIWGFMKDNWPWLVVLIGVGVYEVSQWVKF